MINKKLKIVFAGTPEFAVPTLSALFSEGHQIVLVLTQPDRKAGRGMHIKISPIKQKAENFSIPIFQPDQLNNDAVFKKLLDLNADILVVAAYGLIIPSKILEIFSKGAYNVHASLLPAWRGAAPIQRAIEAGDSKIGVTIMSVAPKLDTGDMIRKKSINLGKDTNTGEMTKYLSKLGAELMVNVVNDIAINKTLELTKQNEKKVTYANKIKKSEAKVIWKDVTSEQIMHKVNAFNPFPGVFCNFRGKVLKIWKVTNDGNTEVNKPGSLFVNTAKGSLFIATVDGAIEVTEIQLEGKRRMTGREFITANKIINGELLL
ncbi:methionyl-tRNA formyltransferase [Methylophilaceae bacterium]|jgi:methionyl-tRNA formyltransferase|nr:methionyl-tRNA formyltransferase [Methylophilaceae bacterium]|tara:strand:+ start:1413 stop:2366 length:954 start_codon:yes stop_codon:yes gene_type:complete